MKYKFVNSLFKILAICRTLKDKTDVIDKVFWGFNGRYPRLSSILIGQAGIQQSKTETFWLDKKAYSNLQQKAFWLDEQAYSLRLPGYGILCRDVWPWKIGHLRTHPRVTSAPNMERSRSPISKLIHESPLGTCAPKRLHAKVGWTFQILLQSWI